MHELETALTRQDAQAILRALHHGAGINAPLFPGQPDSPTALDIAAAKDGSPNMTLFLLHHGARVTRDNFDNVCQNGYLEQVRLLASQGVPYRGRDAKGATPLHYAAQNHDPRITRLLLAHGAGADVNARDEDGNTPLLRAAEESQPSVIALLLRHGARVNVHNKFNDTPLHCAAQVNSPACVRLLLNAGADLRARDKEGLTPLHAASEHWTNRPDDRLETMRLLINAGAPMNVKDRSGYTPLDLALWAAAKEPIDPRLVSYLRKRGGKATIDWGPAYPLPHGAAP